MERLTPLPWQETLWQQVLGAIERLPHALLLHGARGVGKRHFAGALAQSLMCETPDAQRRACGTCPGCLLMAADNHPDLRWLVPESDRPAREDNEPADDGTAALTSKAAKASRAILIDQVRDVGEFLALAAHRGGRRIVLLAPAEALNGPAANALLKLLEEPPVGAMFIAVTDELDAVLPTVRSRCVLLRAPVPPPATALAWLKSQGVEDADARLAEAGGAPVGLERRQEEERDLPTELKGRLLELLGRGPRLTLAEVISTVPKDVPVSGAIRLFQRWGWDLLAEREAQRVRYYPRQQRAIAAVARATGRERLIGWLDQLTGAQATAMHPLNAKLAVESALIGYMDAMRPASPEQGHHA
ncbi:MAG TPA: DNA polymerase III subunit delta' [Burkholderiaceae bacterium]|nr:DNA polymerase III subunit delta' [Burkholderiaceae bacterium]